MTRAVFASLLVSWALFAQRTSAQQSTKPPDTKPADTKSTDSKPAGKQVEEPPEEDEALLPKQCALNPLEASHNIYVGDFHFKRSKYPAAVARYKEAICWDPSSAEAYLKLGEAEEKLHNRDQAREAYQKYLTLAPEAKNTAEIKKRLLKLPLPKN